MKTMMRVILIKNYIKTDTCNRYLQLCFVSHNKYNVQVQIAANRQQIKMYDHRIKSKFVTFYNNVNHIIHAQ